MSGPVMSGLWLLAMIVVIVGVDVAFFRHFPWERLAVNVGIVLIFIAFYFRFVGRHGLPRT